jgi:hypothetical protein
MKRNETLNRTRRGEAPAHWKAREDDKEAEEWLARHVPKIRIEKLTTDENQERTS